MSLVTNHGHVIQVRAKNRPRSYTHACVYQIRIMKIWCYPNTNNTQACTVDKTEAFNSMSAKN